MHLVQCPLCVFDYDPMMGRAWCNSTLAKRADARAWRGRADNGDSSLVG